MGMTEEQGVKNETNDNNEQKPVASTVKGTMLSVGIVGAVIFIFYVVVYGLYMLRA